jgi:large subunit ribosomal protein L18
MAYDRTERRSRIRRGIRKKIAGSVERPRLSVFRSNTEIYAQIIDDLNGRTLVAASTRDKSLKDMKAVRMEQSAAVGKLLAEKALAAGVTSVVFDRGGYLYHGRVKALAEGAREGGLQF